MRPIRIPLHSRFHRASSSFRKFAPIPLYDSTSLPNRWIWIIFSQKKNLPALPSPSATTARIWIPSSFAPHFSHNHQCRHLPGGAAGGWDLDWATLQIIAGVSVSLCQTNLHLRRKRHPKSIDVKLLPTPGPLPSSSHLCVVILASSLKSLKPAGSD